MKQFILALFLSGIFGAAAVAQQEIFLFPDMQTPTPKDDILRSVSSPSITVWLPAPEIAVGKAVIVCPGGGYGALMMEREGHRIAREFNKSGIAALVLKYRLPDKSKNVDQSSWPLQDAQTAIKTVRQRAGEWKVDPNKIGIMGFSAGGHLASTAGTHYDKPAIKNPEGVNIRPDFMILVYPVVSFQDYLGHTGSRANLLGDVQTKERIDLYSNELHVSKTTPPTFLTHGSNDATVKVGNSIVFYEALTQNGVPAEMHIYADGKHGYGQKPPFDEWFGRCLYWLKTTFE